MTNLIFYNPRSNKIMILKPNIGEYWGNYIILMKDYDPYRPKQFETYLGTIESILDKGWTFIGDYHD